MSSRPIISSKGEQRDDIRAAADDLVSVRDYLRFAVSEFTAAELAYGHGTDNAFDEAAFLILASLKLPIDALDPWLDARLTMPERAKMADLIAARIETRKPAPYLVGEAWIGPYRFAVDERVIVPRSFIGELILQQLPNLVGQGATPIVRALDLCTGSGCLAILLAEAFQDADIVATDLSGEALAVARGNVAGYGLSDRVQLVQSDLFEALQGERFDLIISNPPYVTAEAVDSFPPEYAAEPEMAHLGGADGLDLVRRILREAGDHLKPGGSLIVEVGQERTPLEEEFPDTPFLWLDTEMSEGEVFRLTREELPAAIA